MNIRTSTNGHLSTADSSVQQTYFFVPVDSPYIPSYFCSWNAENNIIIHYGLLFYIALLWI